MHHPRQLFGSLLEDGRAVRRYWARLAREFRDTEPEVFQHARRLFERARDGQSAAVEPVQVVHADGEAPNPRVRQWLADGDYAALAHVLEHDPGSIPQQARMQDVLLDVVRGMGPDLTASQLLAVERELAHDRLMVTPDEEITLRLAVAQSEVVRRLRKDDAVPESFVDLVNAARAPDAAGTVSAMNRLVNEVPMPALRQVLTYVRIHHSGALSVIERRMLLLRERETPKPVDDLKAAELYAAYVDANTPSPALLLAGAVGFGVALFMATNIVLIALMGEARAMAEDMRDIPMALGGIGICLGGAVAYSIQLDRKKTSRAFRTGRILAIARRFGLFPAEVVDMIVKGMRPSTAASQTYTKVDVLVALEADPTCLFECWSDVLAARFAAPPTESSS